MKPLDYITSELQNCARYSLTPADQARIAADGLEDFAYAKLTSKKFRKWAVDESSERQAKHAIHLNISQGQPLQFRYPFGGYKLWRLPGSPEVDWAEFFSIAYYCKYLAPLAAAYEPGVELQFGSDDVIIERMDNVPTRDTDAYFHSFQSLLAQFQRHFPENFHMAITRIGDLYDDKTVMEQELAENVTRVKREYAANTDESKKQKMYTTSELNICWDGSKDLTALSETEKRKVIEMGPIYHDAYGALSKRRDFNRGEDKIVIFTTTVPNAIAIGTTRSTITKFWTGFGVLEAKTDGYKPVILSPSQLTVANEKPFELVAIDLSGLTNFKQIRVYDTKPVS